MHLPFFSVTLPTFNRGNLLKGAIRSILEQQFTDFELLIADNGSTDATADVIRQFQDPRIRVFRHNHTINAIDNLNFVVGEAHGRYWVSFADDDRMSDIFLSRAHAALSAHPNVKAYASNVLCLQYGRQWRSSSFWGMTVDQDRPFSATVLSQQIILPMLLMVTVFAQSAVCVERELIQSLLPFDIRFPVAPDRAMWARVAAVTDWMLDQLPLVVIGKHSDNFAGGGEFLRMYERVILEASSYIWDCAVKAGHDMSGLLENLPKVIAEDDVRHLLLASAWEAVLPESEPILRGLIQRLSPLEDANRLLLPPSRRVGSAPNSGWRRSPAGRALSKCLHVASRAVRF